MQRANHYAVIKHISEWIIFSGGKVITTCTEEPTMPTTRREAWEVPLAGRAACSRPWGAPSALVRDRNIHTMPPFVFTNIPREANKWEWDNGCFVSMSMIVNVMSYKTRITVLRSSENYLMSFSSRFSAKE